MWRIIGVFNENTASDESELVKIIRDEPLTNTEVPESYTYKNVSMVIKNTDSPYSSMKYAPMYWNYGNYFGQTNTSDWTNSSLQYYLNDGTTGASSYYNSITSTYREMIETVKYDISSIDVNITTKESYNSERSGNVIDGNVSIWTGKIGMMYPSDYGYSAMSEAWTLSMYLYGSKNISSSLKNWMNDNIRSREWTITPSLNASVLDVDYIGDVNAYGAQSSFAVSPVLYLKNGVLVTDGDGSYNNPYKLG